MPKKGEQSPKAGKGIRSKVWRETHQLHKYGAYWRSEKDFQAWYKEHSKLRKTRWHERRPDQAKRIGYGRSCKERTPTHTFHGGSRWWRSQADFKRYNRQEAVKKAADKAGLSIDRYLEIQQEAHDAVQNSWSRDKYLKNELERLRQKYGLSKQANRTHLQHIYIRTQDPEIRDYLHLQSSVTMSDTAKVQRIRELFLEGGHSQLDLLYRTALTVGINLRRAS